MIAVDIAIIVIVKKHRAKKQLLDVQAQNLKKKTEQIKKTSLQYKIFHIAMGNVLAALMTRGGENVIVNVLENYIEVVHPECVVGKDLRYLNNNRMRRIVYALFKSKAKNGVIYITRTALCHLVSMYGLDLPAFPIPIQDFIGVSSSFQFMRKLIAVAALGIPLPMFVLAQGPGYAIFSIASAAFGIFAMAFTNDSGFFILETDYISDTVLSIRRRMPDVVTVDLNPVSHTKISMTKSSQSYECSLPEQIIFDPRCSLTPTEIATVAGSTNLEIPLEYDQVVNLQDVTHLPNLEFNDRYEVVAGPKPKATSYLRGTKNFKNGGTGKIVSFLEKFADPNSITEAEQWDTIVSDSKPAIRIPNKEL
jgi:hypothetical protein